MLPDQYAEEDDRYGGSQYVDERYGTGTDVGEERYGGGAAGGERYGVSALLYGDVDDGYGVVTVGDGRYAGPAGAVEYEGGSDHTADDPFLSGAWLAEFGLNQEYT